MNAISQTVFQFNQSANVRTFADEKGEYWFLANDVCAILGYTNPRKSIADHCRPKGVTKRYTPTQSGEQEMTYINEPNLYRLIIKSRKPEAEAFEEWVMEEVLPTIRKTGHYELHLDRWLEEWEREQIRAAVKERCARTGESSQAVYAKLHRFMGVPSYEQIGVSQFQTALNFLASMENAPELFSQAVQFDEMEIARFATIAYYCKWACSLLKEVARPLRALGYDKACTMQTLAEESTSFLKNSRQTLERELPNITDPYYRDHIKNSLHRFDII